MVNSYIIRVLVITHTTKLRHVGQTNYLGMGQGFPLSVKHGDSIDELSLTHDGNVNAVSRRRGNTRYPPFEDGGRSLTKSKYYYCE